VFYQWDITEIVEQRMTREELNRQYGADSDRYEFKSRGFPWRLYSGPEAIENYLKEEVIRAGAKRAFVVCSKSIASKTTSVQRIQESLGDLFAGYYDGIEVDSTYKSTKAAADAAREAEADLLIAVGGGSVIVATRVVDIFLCEPGDPFEIMTQYPEGKPAYSPRLNEPKLPIINVVTTPTGAMNRAGSGLANPDLDQRMEYFDPKTRPIALFWDWEAIMATPVSLMRSTATTTFSGALSGLALPDMNPILEADREHIFRLAWRAYPKLVNDPESIGPRLDLFAAAFLGNRADDDDQGRRGARRAMVGPSAFSGNYAIATALHIRYPDVLQGEATCSLIPTVARRSEPPLEAAQRVATAISVWQDGMNARQATDAVADALESLYRRVGMPTRLSELPSVKQEDIPSIAQETVKVFNFNPGVRNREESIQDAIDLMEAAW
jgi:alcohol dehydrogenase class IV